jgi:hypothetical protein
MILPDVLTEEDNSNKIETTLEKRREKRNCQPLKKVEP